MTKVIETAVPIPVATLREIVGDPEVALRVNLTESKERVKPLQALIYLSNLELPVDVTFDGEDALEVLDAYINLPTLLKCRRLETMLLEVMLQIKGIAVCNWVTDNWIKERIGILGKWLSLIDSMSLYMMTVVQDDKFQSATADFPVDDSSDTKGINFVHLFDNPLFPIAMEVVDDGLVRNYTKYFNDYMFKSKNLYSYWAIPENDLHLLLMTMVDDEVLSNEEFTQLVDVMKKEEVAIEEL